MMSMGACAWHSAMNRRLRSRSRLPTATIVELPVLRIAFQFLRPIWAVLKKPQRSLFAVMRPSKIPSTNGRGDFPAQSPLSTANSHSKAPSGPIGRTNQGVGCLIIGESHRHVIPTKGLTRETNGDDAKQSHLCQWTTVIKAGTSLPARPNRLHPIPGVSLDARDFFRRRVLVRILLHQAFRKQMTVGRPV